MAKVVAGQSGDRQAQEPEVISAVPSQNAAAWQPSFSPSKRNSGCLAGPLADRQPAAPAAPVAGRNKR